MRKGLIATAAAVSLLSAGMFVPALAGGATSAPSRYNGEAQSARLSQIRHGSHVQTADFGVTEFSSSSAKSAPKR
jgi:hypothetical protein